MVPRAILFDLGNTLVAYYRKDEFAPILRRAVMSVIAVLQRCDMVVPSVDAAMQAALAENSEAADHRFSPLMPRLQRIFNLPVHLAQSFEESLAAAFMEPIFATARVYEDTIPVLDALRHLGIKTAIVSNSPWGSTSTLWQLELARLDLRSRVDAAVFCGDVGWRKPALPIFQHAAALLQEKPEHCVFCGDDPDWDIRGSRAAGMKPLLLDRVGMHAGYIGDRIVSLTELLVQLRAA